MIQKSILVVDAEGDIRENVRRVLAAAGYLALTAATAAEARQKIGLTDYDLLICDAVANNVEIVEHLRNTKKYASIPVLAITSMDEDATPIRLRETCHTLAKPFDSAALLKKVRGILDW